MFKQFTSPTPVRKIKLALSVLIVVGSATGAVAQSWYPMDRYHVPSEQLEWYDRNAVGTNV